MANSMMKTPYVLPIWETITTAWEKTYGAKATIWAGIGITIVVSFLIGILEGMTKNSGAFYSLLCLIGNIIIYFMQLGLLYMGIRRAIDTPIEWKMVFRVLTDFNTALWIILAYLIMFVIYIPPILIAALGAFLIPTSAFIGTLCFMASFLVFIYLSTRLLLTFGYILDKNMNAWDAIKASYHTTKNNVLNIIGIIILEAIIVMISAIPLGIGLIWTLPFAFILYGLMYQRLSVNNS